MCKKSKEVQNGGKRLRRRERRQHAVQTKVEEARKIEKTKANKANSDPLDIFY